jgi:hypothetical protein
MARPSPKGTVTLVRMGMLCSPDATRLADALQESFGLAPEVKDV